MGLETGGNRAGTEAMSAVTMPVAFDGLSFGVCGAFGRKGKGFV